jgi:hypothetical protein
VLLLIPAAVLVLVVLGGISVDAAVVYLGQRELGNAVAAAANDAAGAAFSQGPFYGAGQVELDPARAAQIAGQSLAARAARGIELDGPPVVVVSGRQVCVHARAHVRRIFAGGIPGATRSAAIDAVSRATLRRDGDQPSAALIDC